MRQETQKLPSLFLLIDGLDEQATPVLYSRRAPCSDVLCSVPGAYWAFSQLLCGVHADLGEPSLYGLLWLRRGQEDPACGIFS